MIQDFVKQMTETINSIINDVHTAIPAQIIDFDANTGRVTVNPYGKMVTKGKSIAYPMIGGVPVVSCCSVSGNAGIVFPVCKGDDCLLIISEQDISAWLDGGEQEINLKYDLTSAIAIVGLTRTCAKHLPIASSKNLVRIFSGSTTVDITPDTVQISNGGAVVTIADGCTTITGDVSVSGNLSVSGNISYGSLS